MFRRVVLLMCAVLVTGSAVVITAGPASAAPQCTFRPAPPKRMAVGKNVVRMHVGMRVRGASGCAGKMIVTTHLVRRKNDYYLTWFDAKPKVQKVYAGAFAPGRYHTTRSTCSAYDAQSHRLSCAVARASTVIKYSGRTQFSARRNGSVVRFGVRARQFVAYQGFRPMRDHVAIQRRARHRWVTIHSGVAPLRSGLHWSYRHASAATYRAVSAGTARTFASVSDPISK
jgi:hypothetical protein